MARVPSVGLLAPVPFDYLAEGVELCKTQGRVAFGTRVWEAFADLETEAGLGCPVLIYASHAAQRSGSVVSWVGRFGGWRAAVGGGHPDGDLYRPPSTQLGDEDRSRYWLGFWEVTHLRELDTDDRISIGSLKNLRGRKYGHDFVPEGPILISGLGGIDVPRLSLNH